MRAYLTLVEPLLHHFRRNQNGIEPEKRTEGSPDRPAEPNGVGPDHAPKLFFRQQ